MAMRYLRNVVEHTNTYIISYLFIDRRNQLRLNFLMNYSFFTSYGIVIQQISL